MSLNQKLSKRFSDNISKNIKLSNYSWFNLGGPAEYLFKPENKSQLIEFLKENKKNKAEITILGAGSNTLIRDNGIKGVVIKLGSSFSNIKLTVANPDKLNAEDRDIGRIYLGDPFSVNPAVKGNEYTDTIMELISLISGLTNAVKSLSGKGEPGTAEVSFKHLDSALEVITTSLSELKREVGTGKKDLSTSVFVQ